MPTNGPTIKSTKSATICGPNLSAHELSHLATELTTKSSTYGATFRATNDATKQSANRSAIGSAKPTTISGSILPTNEFSHLTTKFATKLSADKPTDRATIDTTHYSALLSTNCAT